MIACVHAWFVAHYDVLHDFAGPVATLVAATVAAFITLRFGQIQARIAHEQTTIARQQANITLDRLRFDLFEKRYAIFQAARALIQTMITARFEEDLDSSILGSRLLALDEALFFFPQPICNLLDTLRPLIQEHIQLLAKHKEADIDQAERAILADKIADVRTQLRILLASMPEMFQSALSFEQLTRSSDELRDGKRPKGD